MKINCFQHVTFEGLGFIADWVNERGYDLSVTKLYDNEKIPNLENYDTLIIMGGSMSVHDEDIFPWLKDEKAYIRKAIKAKKHVLGVCLGAQLIAEALGGKVTKMPAKEIGWFPIAWHDAAMGNSVISGLNPAMNVFHWHGEEFSIPDGAISLASSKACANQAFLYSCRVLGLQFHLEMAEENIEELIKNCEADFTSGVLQNVQTEEIIREKSFYAAACRRALFRILDNWLTDL